MRLLFVIVVILGALAFNGLAAESEPTNLDKVRAVFNFLIEDSFEKYDKEAFKNGLLHFAKAYGDKEQMEEWYKIPEQERDCVKKSKLAWNYKILNGSFCSTDAELIKMMEKDCPETKEKLNAMFEKQKEKMKQLPEEFTSYVEKMPLSFKLLFMKMYTAFENLKKDCNFLSMDKIRAEFLPIIEDRRKIPDEDLQKMAEVFPDMAPAWTGELKKYGDMSLCSLNQWMKTGKLDFMGHVKALRAFVKLSPFKRGIIKKGLDKLMEKKEQENLPEFVVKGIEKDVNEGVDWIDNFLQGKSNN